MRRRALLAGLSASPLLASGGPARAASPIQQPARPSEAAFVARAFAMRDQALAAGDQGVGAIVVLDDVIVGIGPSRVVSDGDPTAHAEMVAIRDAASRLGRRDLSGAILYSSFRPCAMCESAAYWANVARMIHGRPATNAGAPTLGGCG